MAMIRRPTFLLAVIGLCGLLALWLWYRGTGSPLNDDEQANYLRQLQQLSGPAAEFVDTDRIAAFMASDDGKPFYVVNVFKIRQRTAGITVPEPGLSGLEAMNRFSRAMVPVWLKHGAHPVFVSQESPAFSNAWDMVSVVRYRSRRDFVAIQLSQELAAALPYRIAATEENIRLFLPGTVVPPLLLLAWLSFFILLAVVYFGERKFLR